MIDEERIERLARVLQDHPAFAGCTPDGLKAHIKAVLPGGICADVPLDAVGIGSGPYARARNAVLAAELALADCEAQKEKHGPTRKPMCPDCADSGKCLLYYTHDRQWEVRACRFFVPASTASKGKERNLKWHADARGWCHQGCEAFSHETGRQRQPCDLVGMLPFSVLVGFVSPGQPCPFAVLADVLCATKPHEDEDRRCGTCALASEILKDEHGRTKCDAGGGHQRADGPPWPNCRFWRKR